MPSGSSHNKNDRQRVLDATDIVRLVGEHCALKPRGREFVCLCPFHDDHSPSMYVVPNKQIYHCFSCGAGGNAIDFVIAYHKIPFLDALRLLADRAGVPLTLRRRDESEGDDTGVSRDEIAAANQYALEFFRSVYRHAQAGERARAVVAQRDISPEMVEAFHIGAAPDRWDGLLTVAQNKGPRPEALLAAGLVRARPNSPGLYDTFRNRLVFPIHDQLGRVVAFGARRINDEDDPKYLNSPETALFDKSSTLYALAQANRAIQRERTAIVTEGYTDAIACHQHGVEHVVATLGTALTSRHAAILRRLADTVVLLFDSDDAGARAADRALEVFFDQPIDVKIAVLPGGKDPAEILQQPGGGERFRAAVDAAADALEHRFQRLADRLAPLPETARARAIDEDLARLVELGIHKLNPIRKRLVVQRLARIARVDERAVMDAMPRGGRPHRARVEIEAADAPPAREGVPTSPVASAIACLLARPDLLEGLDADDLALLKPESAAHPRVATIARALFDAAGADPDALFQGVLAALDDEADRRMAVALSQHAQRVTDGGDERLALYLRDCLRFARLGAGVTQHPEPALDTGDQRAKHPSRIEEELEALRHRQKLGGDPRAFPRAASASPP